MESKQLAALAAHLADTKKSENIRVLDISRQKFADYFVILGATSRPHVKAIFQEIHVVSKALGETHGRVEGADLGWWVLMDFGDVVVHIMQPEAREYYNLDGLYEDASELDWKTVELPELPQLKRAE